MNLKYSVSIEKNTNKLISSSEDKFIGISNSSMIKLEDDPTLYTIQKRETSFFIKDFEVENTKIIKINENIGINLQKEDTIKITYKEYEAKFIIDIINPGSGYVKGDIINIVGGITIIDPSVGIGMPTKLEVIDVDEIGSIKELNIKENGKYITIPQTPCKAYSTRGGDLLVNIKYLELSNRSIIERTIQDIYFSDGKTFLVLNYSIPTNIQTGKLSTEKTFLTLNQNYNGDTKRNIFYQVYTHFTPGLQLPLLIKGSLSSDLIINKSLLKIDEEISKIKKHLNIT